MTMTSTLPQFPWLTLVVLLPLVGVLFCMMFRNRPVECRAMALVTALAVFGVTLYLFVCHGQGDGRWLLYEDASWIARFGSRYVLAMDGIALLMILLTAFMHLAALLLAWRVEHQQAGFLALLLLMESGLMGIFLAYDLVFFYLFWEVALIPMFFLISIWGGANRRRAAIKFFLYTLAGSFCMLVAIIALYQIHGTQTGTYTFVIGELLGTPLTATQEGWLLAGFLAAFIVKSPLVPFHTWLTDALTEAPAAGSLDLTGLLLKTGIYGLIRVAFPLFPSATASFLPILGVMALVGLFYAAWSAYHQDDIKRLIAYSSISHLGLLVLGLAAWQLTAWEGSILLMVVHGLTTGALFILVALIRERMATRSIQDLGGLWGRMPCLAFFFLLFGLASLGLPGLANFAGEILVLLGTFKAHPAWAVVALLGVVFAAAYMLRLIQGVVWGPARSEQALPDLTLREWLMLLPLALLVVWLGLYPAPFLAPLHGTVATLLAGGLP
jgi:NADH-quinone oxidoreductase subunit M